MPKVHTKIVQKKTPRSVGVQEKWSAGVHVAYGVWACTLWQGAGISLIHWETLSLIIPEPCPFKQLWAASRGFNSDCAAFDYNYTPLTLQETLLIVPKRNTFLSKHQTHFPLCLSQWFHGLIFILRYKIKQPFEISRGISFDWMFYSPDWTELAGLTLSLMPLPVIRVSF